MTDDTVREIENLIANGYVSDSQRERALDHLDALRARAEAAEAALATARAEGVAAERAAVVAWLRECALDLDATGAEMRLLHEQADRIGRGEHRPVEGT
jgi:hypothetical protein